MSSERSLRDFDWWLLAVSLVLCAIGVLQIYSATLDTKWRDAWWKQLVWIGIALFCMWLVMQVDYHTLLGQVPVLYSVCLGLLLLTFALGSYVFGSRRWIGYGWAKFQTSEFFKVVLVLLVARYLSELQTPHLELRNLARLVGLVGLPMVLVMMQPDLGTSLTYAPILMIGVFLAGLRWQHLLAIVGLAIVLLPASWFVLRDYQKSRIMTLVDPQHDAKGAGYQVIQSKIAIGSGGIWGQGATKGLQTQLRFLPVPHTDFIFSAFAEEHGFVGVTVVLVLFFLMLLQIVQNAQTAPDREGLYICMGVAALILFHLLVNIGMVVGRMPVTGIPLPFLSSGGSNLVTMFILLGLVNNVRLRRFGS
jgi:rod shape determining protein RodA